MDEAFLISICGEQRIAFSTDGSYTKHIGIYELWWGWFAEIWRSIGWCEMARFEAGTSRQWHFNEYAKDA